MMKIMRTVVGFVAGALIGFWTGSIIILATVTPQAEVVDGLYYSPDKGRHMYNWVNHWGESQYDYLIRTNGRGPIESYNGQYVIMIDDSTGHWAHVFYE